MVLFKLVDVDTCSFLVDHDERFGLFGQVHVQASLPESKMFVVFLPS